MVKLLFILFKTIIILKFIAYGAKMFASYYKIMLIFAE